MGKTQVKSRTEMSTKVGIAVAVVMLAAALATVGPKIVSSFAAGVVSSATNATSTPAFNCYDSDGGKNFTTKGTVTVDNSFSLTDSCKNATTLNEAWCDPVRKYVNNVEQTCAGMCAQGKCTGSARISVSSTTINKLQTPGTATSSVEASFILNVSAVGGDVYITGGLFNLAEFNIYKDGLIAYTATTTKSSLLWGGGGETVSGPWQDLTNTGFSGWKLPSGSTGSFRVRVVFFNIFPNGSFLPSGSYKVGLSGFKWAGLGTGSMTTPLGNSSSTITSAVILP